MTLHALIMGEVFTLTRNLQYTMLYWSTRGVANCFGQIQSIDVGEAGSNNTIPALHALCEQHVCGLKGRGFRVWEVGA